MHAPPETRSATPAPLTVALAGDIVEAARQGKVVADFDKAVADAEETARRAKLAVAVLELAHERAEYQVIYGTDANVIVSDHLRPALEAVLEDVRASAARLAGMDVTAVEPFTRAPDAVRKAYNTLMDNVERYRALRTAQRAAGALVGGPQIDRADFFAEFMDPASLGIGLGGPANRPPPYPEHPAARLLWVATVGREQAWMPTVEQQDQRAQEFLDEQAAKNRGRGITIAARALG